MVNEPADNKDNLQRYLQIIRDICIILGVFGAVANIGRAERWVQLLVLVLLGVLFVFVFKRQTKQAAVAAGKFVQVRHRAIWLGMCIASGVLLCGALHLYRCLRVPSMLREIDRTVRADLQQGGRSAQSQMRDFLLGDGPTGEDKLLASVLLRFGLFDYERGTLSRQEVADLVNLCSCICPDYLWPRWTTIPQNQITKEARKDRPQMGLFSDPNAVIVMGPARFGSGRAVIASELSTRIVKSSVKRGRCIRVIDVTFPPSAAQEVYLGVLAARTGASCFAWIDSRETANFGVYNSAVQNFLACSLAVRQFPASQVDWPEVERYFREYDLLSVAHQQLTEGDYHAALHELEYLNTDRRTDSVFGVHACILKGLLHLLLGQRDRYYQTTGQLAQWQQHTDFPFAELLGKLGEAFFENTSDPNELLILERNIQRAQPTLSSAQSAVVEALLSILQGKIHAEYGGYRQFYAQLAAWPTPMQEWQRDQLADIIEWCLGKKRAKELEVTSYFNDALRKAEILKRHDVALVAQMCRADTLSSQDAATAHLQSISQLIYDPQVRYLYPQLFPSLLPRLFREHPYALTHQQWDQLFAHVLDNGAEFITSGDGRTSFSVTMRDITTLADLMAKMGPSTSQAIDRIMTRMNVLPLDDPWEVVEVIFHLVTSYYSGPSTLEQQVALLEKLLSPQVRRPDQSFRDHYRSAWILGITAFANLLTANHDVALRYTDEALQHSAIAKKGNVEMSGVLDFALTEQALYILVLRGDAQGASLRNQAAEAALERLLSHWWESLDSDPQLFRLGKAMIPSVAELVQQLCVLRLLTSEYERQTPAYAEYVTHVVYTFCEQAADAVCKHLNEVLENETLPAQVLDEARREVKSLTSAIRQILMKTKLMETAQTADDARAHLTDMMNVFSQLSPGCGLPNEGIGRTVRFAQLVAADLLLASSQTYDLTAPKQAFCDWIRRVAASTMETQQSDKTLAADSIMTTAYLELHLGIADIMSLADDGTVEAPEKAVRLFSLFFGTLDRIWHTVDTYITSSASDKELRARLLPGTLPEEALISSLVLQVRAVQNAVRSAIASSGGDPNLLHTIGNATSTAFLDVIDEHVDLIETHPSRDLFNVLLMERSIALWALGEFERAAQSCDRLDVNGFATGDRRDAALFAKSLRMKLLYLADRFNDCLSIVDELQRDFPELERDLAAIAGVLHWELRNYDHGAAILKDYFASFDPARDGVRRVWTYSLHAPIDLPSRDASITLNATLATGVRIRGGAVHPSFGWAYEPNAGTRVARRDSNALDSPIAPDADMASSSDHGHGQANSANSTVAAVEERRQSDNAYHMVPLHSVRRTIGDGGFAMPWRCALLWALCGFAEGDLHMIESSIRNISDFYSRFGAFVPYLNPDAHTSSDDVDGWLEDDLVQDALVELLTVAALADCWGLEEDARTLLRIADQAFVDTGYVTSIWGAILDTDPCNCTKWKARLPERRLVQNEEELAWIILLSAGEPNVDLSEQRILHFVFDTNSPEQAVTSPDQRAMYIADKLLERCAEAGGALSERQRFIELADRLLHGVNLESERRRVLMHRLEQVRQ